jgi:hypothetical protein
MSEWQPIETAPRERGTSILAYVLGDDHHPMIFVAHWMNPKIMFSSIYTGAGHPDDWEWVSGMSRIKQPTHWMPLPEPPK